MSRFSWTKNDWSSTNYRIYWGVKFAGGYILGVFVTVLAGKAISEGLAWTLALFIIVICGIDAAQFISKRITSPEYHEGKAAVASAQAEVVRAQADLETAKATGAGMQTTSEIRAAGGTGNG